MIEKTQLQETSYYHEWLLKKMEDAVSSAPEGHLWYRRYANGVSVPCRVTGSGKSKKIQKLDPEDTAELQLLQDKMVSLHAIPILKQNIKALKSMEGYTEFNLYAVCNSLGPEYLSSADRFLGTKNGLQPNPAFDCLKERQNSYPFERNAIPTKLGIFRSKSEALEAQFIQETGCRFKYEPAILVGSKMICPDFAVDRQFRMDVGIIEHLGLLERPEYREKKFQDIRDLIDHGYHPGINLLLISESRTDGFDAEMARRQIRAFCMA